MKLDYQKIRDECRFYFSEPNQAKPPTAGLWLNKSQSRYEVWDYCQYKKTIEFEMIAHAHIEIEQHEFEEWMLGCVENMKKKLGEFETVHWITKGCSTPKVWPPSNSVH